MGREASRFSRRAVLKTGGAGAALGALLPLRGLGADVLPRRVTGQASDEAGPEAETFVDPTIDTANIQGNVLAGFNKDHQRLLFFRLGSAADGRRWLHTVVPEVATVAEVAAFNDLFRTARARRGSEQRVPQASWLNVALTYGGLATLGVRADELASFPEAFREGMAKRAALLGDVDQSAPSSWVGPFASGGVDGLLLLAADDPDALDRLADEQMARMRRYDVAVAFDERGRTRVDEPGHEHFGFKDGISQPGIRGLTERRNPENPDHGFPGQELLWPGEFVLGYPTQIRTPVDDEGGNPNPGPLAMSGPAWAVDGSYLVYRRLRQDVAGFHRFVEAAAAAQGVSGDQLGAKLVGRYKSGAPLERTEDAARGFDPTARDPAATDPTILADLRVNNFEFGDDADGRIVPRAAHIRKVYPRDEETPTGLEADTQTHRILRRGIPFGESLDEGSPAGSPTGADPGFPNDRGLLFLCYQSSIERQFEFVMSQWVNDPDAPERGDGEDPIISQARAKRTIAIPGGRPGHVQMMQRFVTTTAGSYMFQPSLDALRMLASG